MARFVTFSTPFSNLSRNPMDSTSPNVVWRPPGWSREAGLPRLAMGLQRTCTQADTVPIVTVSKTLQGRRPCLCEVIVS